MCRRVTLEGGRVMIVCDRASHVRAHRSSCVRCARPCDVLCDAPADGLTVPFQDEENKGRCSAPLCFEHSYRGEGGTHYCWHHRARAKPTARVGSPNEWNEG